MEETNNNNNLEAKIVIEGITADGKQFRPSDWAERMSGALSTFVDHRIHYSPLLKPSFKNGNKCVIVSPELKESNPKLYQHVLEFAKENNLKICRDLED